MSTLSPIPFCANVVSMLLKIRTSGAKFIIHQRSSTLRKDTIVYKTDPHNFEALRLSFWNTAAIQKVL
jgi:hypothetical protein